jgi:hypothetical protein
MTFAEQFPSLAPLEKVALPDEEIARRCAIIMNDTWKEIISEHCLDKQRVREAIEKHTAIKVMPPIDRQTWSDASTLIPRHFADVEGLLKELGL